ncbi:MAG: hypothetical protein WDO14_01040 [Bacteroidota bacterium]
MSIFLRLRHWQVFTLGFGLLPLTFIVTLVADISTLGDPLHIILFIQTICVVMANFWIFAVGTHLHKKHYYNGFMILIFRWSVYFSTLLNAARFVVFPAIDYFDGSFNTLATVLSLAGKIYCDYFAAQLLNSVEQQRTVPFREFVGDFFSFIFYPIGVWNLQPRINKVFGRDPEVYDPNSPLDRHVTN